jgi:hypothetical protein
MVMNMTLLNLIGRKNDVYQCLKSWSYSGCPQLDWLLWMPRGSETLVSNIPGLIWVVCKQVKNSFVQYLIAVQG